MKRAYLTIGLALGVCLFGVAAAAQSNNEKANNEKTIKDLTSHPVTVKKDTKVESSTSSSASKAMENYRRFLELQKTDPQLRAEALRRLGDLNLDAGEVERMEKEVTAVDLQGGEAIKLYSTLLKAYPDYPLASPNRRWPPWTASSRNIRAPRKWTKCSSAAAKYCSRRSGTTMPRRRTPS